MKDKVATPLKQEFMVLTALAAKQKRIRDWREFTEREVSAGELRERILRKLGEFQALLTNCWTVATVSPEAESQIASYERELEQLHEESRFLCKSGGYSK